MKIAYLLGLASAALLAASTPATANQVCDEIAQFDLETWSIIGFWEFCRDDGAAPSGGGCTHGHCDN